VAHAAVHEINKQMMVKTFVMNSQYKADIDASVFTDEKDYTINNKQFSSGIGLMYKSNLVNVTANYQYTQIGRSYINDSGFVAGFSKFEKMNIAAELNLLKFLQA
jgi:vitamin B12 transporter